jgi:Peptidase family M23
MAKPNLTVTLEPIIAGKATYLPLGAATSDGQPQAEIVLRLHIINNESNRVTVTGISISFPQSRTPVSMKQIDTYNNMNLFGGADTYWSNGFVYLDPINKKDQWPNMVFLNFTPTRVTVSLTCKNGNTGTNYSEPYTVTQDLTPHKSPTSEGSYLFPYSISDLRSMEYFTASALHRTGNGGRKGTQIFAHDIGIVGFNSELQKWSDTLTDSSSKNEDYRIWDKPVRAIAGGDVRDWRDTVDDNTVLHKFPDKPSGAPDNWTSGNYIKIRTSRRFSTGSTVSEITVFCHLKKGSIPNSLKQLGAVVNAGDIIGHVGNSGHTTGPHTHIECTDSSNALRPLPFHDAWIVDYNKIISTNTDGMWVRLLGQGVPKDSVAVWPNSEKPYVDPLPRPPVVEGTWQTVRTGHRLIYLRSSRILDWEPASGHYRIWDYDENATNSNPLKWPPVTQGTWATIKTGHELVFISPIDKMLDWEPATGHWRLWNYDHNASGNMNPLSGPYDQASSSNGLLGPGRIVVAITYFLLIWEPSSGHWDLVLYKTSPPFPDVELFSGDHAEGTWKSIRTGHRIIDLGRAPFENDKPRVLDWEEQSGHYRIFRFDNNAIDTNASPLTGPVVMSGIWEDRAGHSLVHFGGNRVLDWEPASGHYKIWNYDRR